MKNYVDKDKLQEYSTKLTAKYKTIFATKNEVGSPLVASTIAEMIDTNKVYVYTGSEEGYTSGNWYYYDGSEWVSGGIYNAIAFETDDTLTQAGEAADAKATGDAIEEIQNTLNEMIEITEPENMYGNLMPGVRTISSGTKLQFYGTLAEPNLNYLTARIEVSPNTKYTILFNEATDFIQIVSGSNEIKAEIFSTSNPATIQDVNLIASKTDRSTVKFVFTTDSNANYIYICSTITGETDAIIFVGEGEINSIPQPISWLKYLDTYRKSQIDSIFEKKSKMIVEAIENKVTVSFRIADGLFGKIGIIHDVDHTNAKYVDYWRIASGAVYEYDGSSFGNPIANLLIGAENEMAINFQGMGDHIGGYHGNERIDLDNNCYVKFIADGKEYSIAELVNLGTIQCDSFSYREVSQLFASYSYNSAHYSIATHTKITSFGDGGYKTINYIDVDLTDVGISNINILNAYTGLICVAKAFANYAVSDIGTIYTAVHPTTTVILAEEMNKYSRTAKMYNGNYSCSIDSKLIYSNIENYNNALVDVDVWDRQQDLKYYSFLPQVTVETGNYFATESSIKWEIKK